MESNRTFILSKDKTILINLDKIDRVEIIEYGKTEYYLTAYIGKTGSFLGKYLSKEAAMEALLKIPNNYSEIDMSLTNY